MIDVIIPTLQKPHLKECLDSLKHIPFPHRVILVTEGDTWPQAINIGLERSKPGRDIIIMDDDVVIQPDTFKDFHRSKSRADIIGFKLLFPDGRIQHAGGYWRTFAGIDHLYAGKPDEWIPCNYVCHATTSLIYIKRHVIDAIGGMKDLEGKGIHFQDVDFSWRALKAGFRICVHPYSAIHHESLTVKEKPGFLQRLQLGKQEIYDRHLTDDFRAFMADFPMEVENW